MLAQQPLPAGDCRRCRHAAMLEIDAANNLWSQFCRAVPATDPAQNELVDLLACDLEAALIRLAGHGDCPRWEAR